MTRSSESTVKLNRNDREDKYDKYKDKNKKDYKYEDYDKRERDRDRRAMFLKRLINTHTPSYLLNLLFTHKFNL